MVGGENERVVSSPSVSSPLSAGKYLHRLFALCCRRNGIALESLFAADLRRPATALCLSARRELRLPSVNMSARIFRAARRPATFIEAVAQTLICRLLFATRPPSPRHSTRFVDPRAILSRPNTHGFASPSNVHLLSLFLFTPESSNLPRTFSARVPFQLFVFEIEFLISSPFSPN